MAGIIYGACALTAFLCALVLFHGYYSSRYRLLLWGGFCFTGLTLNNIFLILDKICLPAIDLSIYRSLLALISMLVLLYGLIFDVE